MTEVIQPSTDGSTYRMKTRSNGFILPKRVSIPRKKKKTVLFVCFHNVCRSPIAEAVLRKLVAVSGDNKKWIISSAALNPWNVGRNPDSRAITIIKKYDLPSETEKHTATLIKKTDFKKYQYIFGMDNETVQDLLLMKPPDSMAKVMLLGEFDETRKPNEPKPVITDPYYYSDPELFEKCYEKCVRFCTGFLKAIQLEEAKAILAAEAAANNNNNKKSNGGGGGASGSGTIKNGKTTKVKSKASATVTSATATATASGSSVSSTSTSAAANKPSPSTIKAAKMTVVAAKLAKVKK